jgi:hypothetical protein
VLLPDNDIVRSASIITNAPKLVVAHNEIAQTVESTLGAPAAVDDVQVRSCNEHVASSQRNILQPGAELVIACLESCYRALLRSHRRLQFGKRRLQAPKLLLQARHLLRERVPTAVLRQYVSLNQNQAKNKPEIDE